MKVGPHLIKSRHVAPRTIAPENTTAGMVPHHHLDTHWRLDSGLLPGAREEALKRQIGRFRLEEIRGWCDEITHIGSWFSFAKRLVRDEKTAASNPADQEILSYEYNIACFGCRHGQQVWGIEADGWRGAGRGDASRLLGV